VQYLLKKIYGSQQRRSRLAAIVAARFIDIGEQSLKNIARRVRAYRVGYGQQEQRAGNLTRPPMPDRPSIAVLPFQNMNGSPEQEYFADGIVEDITTGLARMSWLFVIARNSSFTYKGRAVDVKQVVANSACGTS
jgi:adenylate cyclase